MVIVQPNAAASSLSPTFPHTLLQPLTGPNPRTTATVLVATDGLEHSDAALRVALERAETMGAHLTILAVAATEPIVSPEMPSTFWTESNMLRRAALQDLVESQLLRVTGAERTQNVILLEGSPAYTISRVAIEQRAAVIVVGLGRHDVQDRIFSDETALQLSRIARVPVRAVPRTGGTATRHAVVAIDFSDLSLRAAQAAVEAVGDDGTVDLVHVMHHLVEDAFSVEARHPYERWAAEQLAALEARLVKPDGVTIARIAIRGRPAQELLQYATTVAADLIVTGTHGRGFVMRSLLGSVTSQLIRAATCTVLTVPRNPLPGLTAAQLDVLGMSRHARQREWSAVLGEFTARNLGRRTVLEIDDLEIGAQGQEHNYPLIAAMFDSREQRVQLMLGDSGTSGRHLTRSIGGITALDVLTDGQGRDVALRIEHGIGQTLLTFAA